jgi:lysophospholipase L1-like esterase
MRALRVAVLAALLVLAGTLDASAGSAPLRIYALGDSITYGSSYPTGAPGGYRDPLNALLDTLDVPHTFVGTANGNPSPALTQAGQDRHDGHPGYRVDQVTRALTGVSDGPTDGGGSWLLGHGSRRPLQPDVVLLHLGTNDVLSGDDAATRYPTKTGKPDFSSARQRAVFEAHLLTRLRTLLDTLHRYRPHATVVVATIVPIGSAFCDAVTPEYAPMVRGLVGQLRAAGRPVVLADAFAAYADTARGGCKIRPGLLSDTVHPTQLGYAVLADVFALALQAR